MLKLKGSVQTPSTALGSLLKAPALVQCKFARVEVQLN